MSDLPYALSGRLSNVKSLGPIRRDVHALVVTVSENMLTVEYPSAEYEDAATRYGHALAARMGARLRADVVWTVTTRREPRITAHAASVNVTARFGLVAEIRDTDLDDAIRDRKCFDQHRDLADIDADLASYRTTRGASHLRDAVDRLAKVAPKNLPQDSPLLASGALRDLVNAMQAHHHGPRAVGRSKDIRDAALRDISVCYERAVALLAALAKRFCP